MMYGDMAEIISPCELRSKVKEIAGIILERNQ